MIVKIDHIVITTKSITETIEFYEKLGFEAKDCGTRYELYAGDFKINVHLLDAELSPHALNVQTGSADICFELSGNLESYKNQLEENGLEIELGIVKRHGVKGEMSSIYLRDIEGNLIEFCSYE